MNTVKNKRETFNHLQLNSIKRQKFLIFLCCLVYSFAYVGRYSYNANISSIILWYGITRADAGAVSTFFFFSYGAGQLINAILCKFYSKRYVIAGSLVVSAIINLILLFLPTFGLIKYLWLINGICQSVLWPTLMLTLGENLEQGMMKHAVLAMSLSVVIGTLVAYGGASLFNLFGAFRFSFLLGTVTTVGIGLIWFLSYDHLVERQIDTVASKDATVERRNPKATVFSAMVGLLVVCGLFAIVDNLVKDGLNTWSPVILKEQFGFDDSISIVLTLVLPIFGVFGSMLAMRTNRVIKDFRNLIGFFYLLLSGCLCGLFLALRLNGVILTLVLFGLISCLTHGINSVLTSIMPLAMRDKMNTGFLAGLMNATCYIGSTISAYGLGKIADCTSWNFVIQILFVASFAAVLLSVGVILVNAIGRIAKKKV